MKKQVLFFALVILFTACTGNKELENVTLFAKDFAVKVSNNQGDSVKALYPDAALCDSFALQVTSNDLVVQETDDSGIYKVTIGNGVDFLVGINEDGELNVVESHGLFAYPEDVIVLAKGMGMWEKELNDAQLAQRLCDDGFQTYLAEKALSDLKRQIEAKEIVFTWEPMDFGGYQNLDKIYVVLKNNSDYNLKKNDYLIKGEYVDGSRQPIEVKSEDVKAHESKKLRIVLESYPDLDKSFVTSGQYNAVLNSEVVLKVTNEDIIKRFYRPTGNEYKEYLSNK